MAINIRLVLLIVALVLFLLSALQTQSRINLTAAGLFTLTLSMLLV